jgi:uncharacterized protein (DUF2384 family)
MAKTRASQWWTVYQMLDRLFTAPEAIEWLETPNVDLGDRKPEDCKAEDVIAALKLLRKELA